MEYTVDFRIEVPITTNNEAAARVIERMAFACLEEAIRGYKGAVSFSEAKIQRLGIFP